MTYTIKTSATAVTKTIIIPRAYLGFFRTCGPWCEVLFHVDPFYLRRNLDLSICIVLTSWQVGDLELEPNYLISMSIL